MINHLMIIVIIKSSVINVLYCENPLNVDNMESFWDTLSEKYIKKTYFLF